MFNKLLQIGRRIGNTRFRKRNETNDFPELVPVLQSALESIESAFGSVGDKVASLDDLTRSIRTECENLMKVSGGKGDGTELLMRAAKALELPMVTISDSISQRSVIYDMMRKSENSAKVLLLRQKDMAVTLEPLKFMLVLFKIEAAQLSEENQNTFKTVSEEILRLHELVDATFQENITSLTEACDVISKSLDVSIRERTRFSEMIGVKRNEIREAVVTLESQLRENALKDTDLDSAASQFEGSIYTLVGSLQYEDILRQRIDSIFKLIENPPEGISNQAFLLLISRQFKSAAEELTNSAGDVTQGLGDIVQQANDLNEVAVGMKQFKHMTASADGMVQMLLDAFESIQGILSSNQHLCEDAQESVEPVNQLARSLSEVVIDMSLNIQLIALNAQVRSIQVGNGSGLEVLAAKTADISSDLRSLGSETSAEIKELESHLSTLTEAVESDRETSHDLSNTLQSEGKQLVDELHQMRDSAFTSLGVLASQVENVGTLIESDRHSLSCLPEMADKLTAISLELEEKAGLRKLSAKACREIEYEVENHVRDARKTVHTQVDRTPVKQKPSSDVSLWEDRNSETVPVSSGELELF